MLKKQVKQTEQIRDDLAQVQGRKDLKQLRKPTWKDPVDKKKQSQLTYHQQAECKKTVQLCIECKKYAAEIEEWCIRCFNR